MKKIVLVALLAISSTAAADLMQNLASPGPLAAAHADLDTKCDKCHVPFKGIPNSSCLSCHTGTAERIKSGVGTHAQYDKLGQKCSKCHGDHKGRKHALSPAVESGFSHAVTGFVLDGKHKSVSCNGCHKPGPNGPRWVGIGKDCKSCHADPHKGSLGATCAPCHSSAAWKPTLKSLADHKVSMTGGHQGLACAQCHAKGVHLQAQSSCGDCHDQQHGGTKAPCATCHNVNSWKSATFVHDFCTCILPGKHQTAACLSCHPKFKFTPTPFACAACHVKERKHDDLGPCAQCHSSLSWKQKTFDHNKPLAGFKILGKHTEVGCENCHKIKGVFKGAPLACEGCHKVPKHGDFGACAQCHDVAGWDKQRFTHDKTRMPLDNQHAKVACETCHAKFKKGEFTPGPNQCALCHQDPHKGQFGQKHAGLSSLGPLLAANGPAPHTFSPGRGCLDCHTTRGWKPSTIDAARHSAFGFELRGQHAAVDCNKCHADGLFVGTPRLCQECHMGPHRGRVANECGKCHDESAWKHTPTFDHFATTGFKLEGPHDRACRTCHGENHEKMATLSTAVTCATCHTPVHGEQFGTRCTECHSATKWSDVPPFNHRETAFPLDRRHEAVRCTTCHDARRGTRLDPMCKSCHGDPHRGRAQLACEECHRADRWTIVRFDHDRTEFPLKGRHFITPCRDCHVNDQFTGTRGECVSCHRGDRQRADMLHMDHRGFTFDCSQCHKAFKW